MEQIQSTLADLNQQSESAFAVRNYQQALEINQKALLIDPQMINALSNIAFCELRLGLYQQAYTHYNEMLILSQDQMSLNFYDGMAEVCYFLDKKDEQLKYGKLAIAKRIESIHHQFYTPHNFSERPCFRPENKTENIISYSLFGDQPRYCETAFLNTLLAKEIFPEWTIRFYVDETVPQHVITRLSQLGAQIIYVSEQQRKISGLFWRFFVVDDPNVKYFLIRDADSFLSYREKAAVDEWLKSSKWFHIMHDFSSHTELMLAGMWGGCHGVLKNIFNTILNFQHSGLMTNARISDQIFLRHCVWSVIEKSCLNHDSQGYFEHASNFPLALKKANHEHREDFHVGVNEANLYYQIELYDKNIEKIQWSLFDENEKEVCHYSVNRKKDEKFFEVFLPYEYAEKIRLNLWKFIYQGVESSYSV
ncbi:tetratricopeptide repeat protein [Acinetobacter sichuanensis]|uniref:tetratricopeptide repeat protein n=1 Tax=Acinetobacter sichuanensis TaxID=2136183 RepID=UPI00280DDC6A|nr:tetratricopeptide repeat protein [Acinetobacter sichuanensis]MDQ9022355.1 tetratricopeptide repeat protein [Acinetobacter sichuanensis]